MADDVRISTALPRHPKTVKLARRLQEPGCWALVCLFLWVADSRPDGNLAGMSNEDIEIAAGWTGEPGAFVAALCEVGFLDGAENAYGIHDWAQHNPWAANRPQRIQAARIAAAKRWDAKRKPGASGSHAERMPVAENRNARLSSPLPASPHPTTRRKPKACNAVALPDWVPLDQWNGFLEMRKRMGSPLTERALQLAIGKLEKLRAAGDEPAEVLDQSVLNGWKGLFPLNGNGGGSNGNGNRAEQRRDSNLTALKTAKLSVDHGERDRAS